MSLLIDRHSTLIFDLFHTLTSVEAVNAPGQRTADILGIPRKDWITYLFMHSHERLTGMIKDPYVIVERLAHAIDPRIRSEVIARAVETRISRFRYALVHPDQDTLSTLRRLKEQQKRIGLVSNADVMEKAGWPDSPLAQFFDCTIFSCDTGYMKPDPEIYEACLHGLQVRPGECMYSGDGSHSELKTARELGMTTVLVTHVVKKFWPERILLAQPYADYEIEHLSALFTLSSDHDLPG
jgi:putative hydrolase of the HAD superfamily